MQRITNSAPNMVYEDRLRVIGRHLDIHGFRGLSLFETPEGLVLRAHTEDERAPEALQFHEEDLPGLVDRAVAARGEGSRKNRTVSPLTPTGYEDFLRALGAKLDAEFADSIVITEFMSVIGVAGLRCVDYSGRYNYAPFEMMLRSKDVEELLNAAFESRSNIRKAG